MNYIHNEARGANLSIPADEGFFRNQGVGSWEINLAAFFADLNTNEWFINPNTTALYYDYEPEYVSGPIAQYRAFDDALTLLNYRYNPDYTWLPRGDFYFPNNIVYRPLNVDLFSDGPLQTTFNTNFFGEIYTRPWPGAENTNGNHFFNLTADLFNSVPGFANHLIEAGTNTYGGATVSTYDRYTFYRLLSQLGTDTAPESDKLNLNYVNVDASGDVVPNMETNFIPWTNCAGFFYQRR
ncbi:MAG: hypothetical protein WDM76_19215 [Limisphaerales bacterium]